MRKVGWRAPVGLAVTVGLMAAALATAPLSAQQESRDRDCRCVDRDGNEIERCTCMRAPRIDAVLAQVLPWGRSRARIGVTVDSDQSAQQDARGARVTAVLDGGPADDAGIRSGDVITRIDGRSLFDPLYEDVEADFDLDESIPVQRLLAIARELEPDTEVEIEYLRGDESRVATVATADLSSWAGSIALAPGWDAEAFGERMRDLTTRLQGRDWNRLRLDASDRPGGVAIWRDGPGGDFLYRRGPEGGVLAFGDAGWRFDRCPGSNRDRVLALGTDCIGGLDLVALNAELGDYFGAVDGVLVTDVHEDSPIGLEPGDVILAVGDRTVSTPARMRRILRTYGEDEEITFRILRERQEMGVSGRLGR